MNVSSINNGLLGSLTGFDVQDLASGKKLPEITGEVSAASVATEPIATMMTRNFVRTDREESRYIDATKASFSVAKTMKNSQKNRITEILDAFGGIAGLSLHDPHGNTKGGGASEAAIKRFLGMHAFKKILESEEENFDEAKKRLEKKAKGALESGSDDSISTALPGGQSQPTQSAESADTAQTPAADTAQSPAAVNTSHVSVDIRV